VSAVIAPAARRAPADQPPIQVGPLTIVVGTDSQGARIGIGAYSGSAYVGTNAHGLTAGNCRALATALTAVAASLEAGQ
jgi:hypothetical protein